MKDDFLWMVAYWQAVARLVNEYLFALFARTIRYFSGRDDEDE